MAVQLIRFALVIAIDAMGRNLQDGLLAVLADEMKRRVDAPAVKRFHFCKLRRRARPFLHDPAEVGTDAAYALRTATGQYRTTPLRGLLQHPPYFHDGSAPTLLDVVNHYDQQFGLNLTGAQKADLVEYLKSL